MLKLLADFVRLVILILLLPLFLVCIGPLVMLAAIRGRQWAGPLMLDSRHYDGAGRAGILMLGLALWLLVWSGLVWLGVTITWSPTLVQLSPLTPIPTQTPHIITPTATQTMATPTALPASPTQALIAVTPPPTATPTFSPTPLPPATPTPSATARVSATGGAGQTPATPTQPANSLFTNRQIAIQVIEEANLLLEKAITLPSEENLANLSQLWQDRALVRVKQFAVNQYNKYGKPFNATVEFIASPAITAESGSEQLVVTSQERWSYGSNLNADQEAFEFIYTLSHQEDGRWKIIHYTYRNLPPATQTETATPTPIQN
jgi:hypothetical protein